ncbi:hypothetical protein DAPPUDRAFT_248709 [Daphnia pulex]|uniref:Uncharacterized protein n=1 Tax=Daphnia pulex TaxID=6669 RepID=E9GV23_DAPPU|nr:hypothetical protein DAPPUDRAFT_248709 [Daphnia pulex]|eukprot:EFX76688.1 hypothetical protein DAPPUDRAFT_248709 [Daphnia pulex]
MARVSSPFGPTTITVAVLTFKSENPLAQAIVVMALLPVTVAPEAGWLENLTCLRHPECTSSRENRDTVFCHMRRAIDLVHYVVKDGLLQSSSDHVSDARTPGNGPNSSSMSNQPKEFKKRYSEVGCYMNDSQSSSPSQSH